MLSAIALILACVVFGFSIYTFIPEKDDDLVLNTERAKYLVQSAAFLAAVAYLLR